MSVLRASFFAVGPFDEAHEATFEPSDRKRKRRGSKQSFKSEPSHSAKWHDYSSAADDDEQHDGHDDEPSADSVNASVKLHVHGRPEESAPV